ncbi:TetR/AcrR family transcriptional regulator [Methylocella sp.]|uniref:TetR/AcrR family transcriptional regulator n=1 Tax=Methylocella sp. TaxID=1978226 RepID=UPI003C1C7D41
MSGEAKGAAKPAKPPARKPRADARRNRELLLKTAKAAFTDVGLDVSLDEIARRAGVGIGTLYRHFPTRGALVEAVYRHGVDELAGAATRLLASLSPGAALHEWMRLFVDYIATKKVIAPALGSTIGGAPELKAYSVAKLSDAAALLVARARASGDIRADVDPDDLLRAVFGFTYGNAKPNWRASALRLIDILMDGLRGPSG